MSEVETYAPSSDDYDDSDSDLELSASSEIETPEESEAEDEEYALAEERWIQLNEDGLHLLYRRVEPFVSSLVAPSRAKPRSLAFENFCYWVEEHWRKQR